MSKKDIIENTFDTIGHFIRVYDLVYRIAEEYGLNELKCKEFAVAGYLHDIGKLALSPDILYKPGDLKENEKHYLRGHSNYSYMIANTFLSDVLNEEIIEAIHQHHENLDGSGYPSLLEDSEINLGSRILKVSDVFDALTSDRPYRDSMSTEDALELMYADEHHYDKKVLSALVKVVRKSELKNLVNERSLINF